MSKKSTVNPGAFDALLKQTAPPPAARPGNATPAPAGGKPPARKKPATAARFLVPAGLPAEAAPPATSARVSLTLRFDPALLDRARNACHATGKSFQQMIDYALWNMTHALEDWNGGKPYTRRPGTLKPGPKPRKTSGK